MKKIYAVKFFSVSLIHSDHIFPSFEYLNLKETQLKKLECPHVLNLFSYLRTTPNKVPLSFYGYCSPFVFNIHSIIMIGVSKDYVGNPNRTHLVLIRKVLINFNFY